MKFIDKKERVMDLKLTSYGHYLLSIGQFKPEFYAFFDDNVLYDGAYAQISESSNRIHERIKDKTQYMESQVLFEEIEQESNIIDEGSMSYYELDISPIMEEPRKDTFRYDNAIGDAFLQGDQDIAPAWKLALLNGKIKNTALEDTVNDVKIPQIDIELNYRKKIKIPDPPSSDFAPFSPTRVAELSTTTEEFSDNKVVSLEFDNLMIYLEEQNTSLLTENFDIEVFEVVSGALAPRCPTCGNKDRYKRKYFEKDMEAIKGGMMTDASISETLNQTDDVTSVEFSNMSSSVSYYFDVFTDQAVNHDVACRGKDIFNKQSLFIDLEFDCEEQITVTPFDIYGPVTEPEICR